MGRIQPQNEGDNYICAKMNRKEEHCFSIIYFDITIKNNKPF